MRPSSKSCAFTKIPSASPTTRWKPIILAQHVGEGRGEGWHDDPDKVIDALPDIEAPNLTGGMSKMLPNHHITKPVLIGEVRADGQFDTVWKTPGLVAGDAWSKELPGSRDLIGDWSTRSAAISISRPIACGGTT